jgi:hypothetical protein
MAITRCKATFMQRDGKTVRCEHVIGHDSAHYSGDIWWPNKRGLPCKQSTHNVWQSIKRWLHDHL